MQTILGSGGIIATELATQLIKHTKDIRLVSRSPVKVNTGDEIFSADLTQQAQVMQAVKGSQIVYLTVGIEYKLKIWHRDWPIIMTNVINACKESGASLVFFDNVYAYGKVDGWMTENTPVNPCSKKGNIRASIAQQLLEEIHTGKLQALIARSADFYGPHASNTFVLPMIFEKLKQGKPASWLCNDQKRHSMTYTPDAGKALALLGNSKEAYNQIWHLPTDKNALNGKEFMTLVANSIPVPLRYSIISKLMMRMVSPFNAMAGESIEMLYQNEHDYLFDSSKFEDTYFKATDYLSGIKATVSSLD